MGQGELELPVAGLSQQATEQGQPGSLPELTLTARPNLYTIQYTMRWNEPIAYITVDTGVDEPAYEQIARQIRDQISSGALPPGTALPPVRTLASDLGYNLNTVARAYRRLEEDGFVRIRNRAGAEVVEPADTPRAGTRRRLGRDLNQVVARLRQAGVRPDEIRRMVEREIASLGSGDEKGG